MGRSRQFDFDEALDRALEVFWRRGYEGATLPELTEAMGINKPSLYAAFGNKEELFQKALERYASGPVGYARKAFEEPTARAVVDALFKGAMLQVNCPDSPKGCLVVHGALVGSEESDAIREALVARRESLVTALRDRFKRGVKEGDLPSDTDIKALARFVATILHGLAVQSAGGANPKELQRVIDIAMRAWPA